MATQSVTAAAISSMRRVMAVAAIRTTSLIAVAAAFPVKVVPTRPSATRTTLHTAESGANRQSHAVIETKGAAAAQCGPSRAATIYPDAQEMVIVMGAMTATSMAAT